jgi:hypothetical protein
MGIHSEAARFLIGARAGGTSFARTLTLGRQHMHVDARTLTTTFRDAGFAFDAAACERMVTAGYAEDFLRALGAETPEAIDVSDYEGAQILWDMNQDVASAFDEKYDVVIDGGALEHIFNFPVGLKNCMRMVRQGGAVILVTPTNNFMGHGFYQFSPELFFRAFSTANGFRVQRMVVVEAEPSGKTRPDAPWYNVCDPSEVHERVELINTRPAYLLVHARRDVIKPIFERPPQQSDYIEMWTGSRASGATSATRRWPRHVVNQAARLLPEWLVREAVHVRRLQRRFDRRYFSVEPKDGGR